MKPKVQVLLSTYNGEKYIETQIASLQKQKDIILSILIRDDGSSDNTTKLLRKYDNHHNIQIIYGENIGVIESFFELIVNANKDNDFFALCDQDDYWLESKLIKATQKIKEQGDNNVPILYGSALNLVDENLKSIGFKKYEGIEPHLYNSLVENVITGCTVVMNKEALFLVKNNLPTHCLMHDWWLYITIAAFGTVIYDEESHIKYRQHDNNVVGMKSNKISIIFDKFKRFVKRKDKDLLVKQATEFFEFFESQLSLDEKQEVKRFINHRSNLLSSLAYSFNMKVFRQNKVDNYLLKVLVAFKQL